MDNEILHARSIAELHRGMGMDKSPTHPLISIIDTADLQYGEEFVGSRFTSDLYCIALKDKGSGIDYGRNYYDFNEGVLRFMAPHQVYTVLKAQKLNELKGWMLYFHPDLIRNTHLGKLIDKYTFFNYEVHEALHLSGKEQDTLNKVISLIQTEICERIDNHSQQVLVSNIQLILDYCVRFYERQMNTRSAQNSDVIAKVEILLNDYFREHNLIELGQPTTEYLASNCHLSPHYLSDLLTKETGKSSKGHINNFLIEKAKHLLLSSTNSVHKVAYTLGFNHPKHFTRLFKQKTGKTPQEYRQLN